MSKLGTSTAIRKALFAATACLVAAMGYTAVLVQEQERALGEAARFNIAFSVSETAVAMARALQSLSALHAFPDEDHLNEAEVRLEILQGRAQMLREGRFTDFIGSSPSRTQIAKEFSTQVAALETELPHLDRPETQSQIINGLVAMDPKMVGLLAEANSYSAEQVSNDQERLIYLFGTLSLLGLWLLLFSFGLVLFMLRQNQSMAQKDRELRTQNVRFDAALNNMMHGLTMYDANGNLIVSNERFISLFGLTPEQAKIGTSFKDILLVTNRNGNSTGLSDDELITSRLEFVSRNTFTSYTRELADGRTFWVSTQPIMGGGWVTTFEDITERRRSEAKISYMALHDSMTDLPNRLQFRDRLQVSLDELRQPEVIGSGKHGFALLLIDIDNFKNINDAYGHPVGDALLSEIANRLKRCVRHSDLVARLGGDEFAVIQNQTTTAEEAGFLATRIVNQIGETLNLDDVVVRCGVSIGVALAPDDGMEANLLLKRADLALYRAKANGKGAFSFFEPSMDADLENKRALEIDLRQAVHRHELVAHYQPLVNVRSGEISGFEALMRWRHPTRGLVPPLDFIPLAEECGLINALGEWILNEACAEAAKWPERYKIAVNISPIQVKTRNLVQTVINALKASGLSPDRLELEITESVFLQENEKTLNTLRELRSLGVRFSMDDFGTGYSSLSCLRSFPFDKLKIDRSFVKDITTRKDSVEIVHAVVSLGKSLGINTTAEGVETEAQMDMLRAQGCTEVQGYMLGKPMPAGDVTAFLETPQKTRAA